MKCLKILIALLALFCYANVFAQQPYNWTLHSCLKRFSIIKNASVDTLNYPSFLKNKNLKIKAELDTAKTNNYQFFILLMDSNRQVLVKQLLKKNTTTIALQTLDSTLKNQIVSIHYTQIPKDKELAKRARVGTKVICYLKL